MTGNRDCTVYIGNLDERVNDRVLYEILIQAGRVIDLYIPCDKETNRQKGFAFAEYENEESAHYAVRLFTGLVTLYNRTLKFAETNRQKGFAFAEYENEESAHYAVRLFTGLVTLYNRTLKFAISGQDKPPQSSGSSMPLASDALPKPKSQPKKIENSKITQKPDQLLTPCRISAYSGSPSSRFPEHPYSVSPYYSQASPPGLVGNGYGFHLKGNSFDYDKCISRSALDNHGCFDAHLSRPVSDSRHSVSYSFDGIRSKAYPGHRMYNSGRSGINSNSGIYSSSYYEFYSS